MILFFQKVPSYNSKLITSLSITFICEQDFLFIANKLFISRATQSQSVAQSMTSALRRRPPVSG